MPGSVGNPVKLDFFQTITEVGWNNVTHVAIEVTMAIQTTDTRVDNPATPDPGHDNRTMLTQSDYTNNWTQGFDEGSFAVAYDYTGSIPSAQRIYRKNSGWETPDAADFDVDVPAFAGSGSVGPWEHTGPVEAGWDLTAGGSGDGKTIPGDPLVSFDGNTSPRFKYTNLTVYTGGPEWVQAPNNSFKYAAPSTAGEEHLFNALFPVPTLAYHKNKAFRACATANEPGSFALWVLFERSPEDDPA